MNKDPNVEKQIEELARSFCGFSKTLKCSECSYECHQKEYARKAFEAGYRKASEVGREIFAEIEEGVKSAVSALQFENNPIHRKVKHETYSSLMRFIKSIEGKYLGEDNNVPPGYMRFEVKAIPATLNVKYTEDGK